MVVETRYAAGSGVLIGSGPVWVLLTDPGDEQVVLGLWAALATAADTRTSPVEAVLAIVEAAFGGEPPGLALVDAGSATSLARGSGHVRGEGTTRVLTLDAEQPDPAGPLRRLVGGVVAASWVELGPFSPAAPVPGLIDGIPAEILAARGPDGPPPPRPRRDPPSPDDTGALRDTAEPAAGAPPRIEEGGHTTLRSSHGADDDPAVREDHDGSTVHRPAHLTTATVPTVTAVSCPAGHLTPPSVPWCRTCRQRVAPQEPRVVPRPALGGLRLPTGEVVPLDRGVVLGRRPAPLPGSTDWPHLVHLPADHAFVSRLHLQVELDGWDVVARDLGSRGGTVLAAPGREPVRMRAGEVHVLEPGTVLDLAEAYAVRFETGPAGPA